MTREQRTMTSTDVPRGAKRGSDGAPLPIYAPQRIKALGQDVVNKIAAGEIIVAPVHALKELIENAVDAGSNSLEIMIKDGGLKLLQISDNGHGINREDLPILCERFTTSKLKAFEDLSSIGTYGFRGEALASISHIAHLAVTTKTEESNCAWRAHYSDGKLVPAKPGQNAEPKATAGRQGTQITVEDLFYNVPTRRRAFRSASEEYAKILDVVGRYAVHCSGVAFSCKKHGESAIGISIPFNASTVDRIRHIHGSGVANELVQYEVADERWGFKAQGWISNANYHIKRTVLLLFINHRAVESSTIKKAVEHAYASFLPKGGHPFVYFSLELDPVRVDVNVHPTKREVNFLNEEEIVASICEEIAVRLAKVDMSRIFKIQTLLPTSLNPIADTQVGSDDVGSIATIRERQPTQKPYGNNLVRTDARSRKITSMLPSAQVTSASKAATFSTSEDMEYEYSDKEPTMCRLTTIKELRAEVRDSIHSGLTEVFAAHTFVGVIDEQRRIAAIQDGVKLYLVDYGMISNEYFYQVGLTDFGNFGTIRFNPPLKLRELLAVAIVQAKESVSRDAERLSSEVASELNWDEVATLVERQLLDRREMLQEYFSIDLAPDGSLSSIPLLMKGYTPSLAKLPQFLLRLGPNVDWSDEKACFATFLRELASFYVPEALPSATVLGQLEVLEDEPLDTTVKLSALSERAPAIQVIESLLFPAFKARLVATKEMMKGAMEVANLKGLYKVFERC
ncbi:MAG: DNA mismatch repair protein [Candelina submexicana]|nr:MAG: DNA mismatch repair protein [Candelina submexicana]